MGNVIAKTASVERIVSDFHTTLKNARSRGGDIRSLAETRLAPLEAAIEAASGQVVLATGQADKVWAQLIAADADSDSTIASVLDEIWNAMGPPSQSPDYTLIAGEGKSQWTDGDPVRQHYGMRVLAKAIRMSTHTSVQRQKLEWAERIEAKASVQEKLARPADEAMAQYEVANGSLRALANSAQLALTRLKRDYKNLDMSESQIHEIIPDQS